MRLVDANMSLVDVISGRHGNASAAFYQVEALSNVFHNWSVTPGSCRGNHMRKREVLDACLRHQSKDIVTSEWTRTEPWEATFLHVIADGEVQVNGHVRTEHVHFISAGCKSSFLRFLPAKNPRRVPRFDEVFVTSQYWADGFFHMSVEALPRMSLFLVFLRRHPSVKIHMKGGRRRSRRRGSNISRDV